MNKDIYKNIIIPILLIIPIVLFSLPLINIGTDNMQMISHFDDDESYIVNYAGKTYSQGLQPLQYGAAYPQFFYYLAGVVLVPITKAIGLVPQIIVEGLRFFNIAVASVTVIFLYFFALRYTGSIWAAILPGIILFTTPDYMRHVVNSRPHILAAVLIIASIYFCFRMLEDPKQKYYWGAIIVAALAAATNYGGIFLVPAIWAACSLNINKESQAKVVEYLTAKVRLISLISGGISLLLLAGFAGAAVLIFKYQNLFNRSKIHGIGDFLHIRPIRLIIILFTLLLIASIIWFCLNKLCQKYIRTRQIDSRRLFLLKFNKSLLYLFYIFVSVVSIFVAINPTYWLFPFETAKTIASHLMLTTMGTTVEVGLNTPIIDQSRFVWFSLLFEDGLLGIWIGMIFCSYLAYEIFTFKNNKTQDPGFLAQRSVLWLYIVSLFLVLVLFVSHRPYHYLFPILLGSLFLIAYYVANIYKMEKSKYVKITLLSLIGILFFIGIISHAREIMDIREIKLAKLNDTGVYVGNWLIKKYSPEKSIWKDNDTYYIPPQYKKVTFPKELKYNVIEEIKRGKYDVLVITNAFDPEMANTKIIDRAIRSGNIRGYKKIKEFEYSQIPHLKPNVPVKYKEITVYSK